jgi:aminoacylase
MDNEAAVRLFQDFLRIPCTSTTGVTSGSYRRAADWLKAQLQACLPGAEVEEVEAVEGKPVVVATLRGEDEALPVLLLNSHYDVVPADLAHWDRDPFAAEIDDDGKIFARGTQDMKSVCVQYIVALQRLLNRDGSDGGGGEGGGGSGGGRRRFLRTVVLTFVPDEEVGGKDGMGAFLRSECFQRIGKIGLALDEGLANPGDKCTVFYGERSPWWVIVEAAGPTGHGSRFIENPATHRLLRVAQKGLEFRQEQERLLGLVQVCAAVRPCAGCRDHPDGRFFVVITSAVGMYCTYVRARPPSPSLLSVVAIFVVCVFVCGCVCLRVCARACV